MRAILFMTFLTVSMSAFAAPTDPVATEIRQPNLRCPITGTANELVFSHKLKKVWIAADGIKTGYELKTIVYRKAKGIGSYGISAINANSTFTMELTQIGPHMVKVSGTQTGNEDGEIFTEDLNGLCMWIQ
jgi:hypothetical protein